MKRRTRLFLTFLTLGITSQTYGLTQDVVLYSENATSIRVVPLVPGEIPDLQAGQLVPINDPGDCEGNLEQPVDTVSLSNGNFIAIWRNEELEFPEEKACYSRFAPDGKGNFTEVYAGKWPGGGFWDTGDENSATGKSNLWTPIHNAFDLNNDQLDDLVIIHGMGHANSNWYAYKVAFGKEDGSFDFSGESKDFDFSGKDTSDDGKVRGAYFTLADVDDDGNVDLVFHSFDTGAKFDTRLFVLKGQGDGSFSDKELLLETTGGKGSTRAVIADFNGDNNPDIFLPPDDDVYDLGQAYIAFGEGGGQFGEIEESIDFDSTQEWETHDTFAATAEFHDVDLDGNYDIVSFEEKWNENILNIKVYWGDGNGQFSSIGKEIFSLSVIVPASTLYHTLSWLTIPICGPGEHWVDGCVSGFDKMNTKATLKVTMGANCDGDSREAILSGPTLIYRGNPVDALKNHPILGDVGVIDGHKDVIETEIVSLQLKGKDNKGGDIKIYAGDGNGNLLDDGPLAPSPRSLYSPGAIHEQSDNSKKADSFFHIFLEAETNLGILHNKSPFVIQSVIEKLPPFKMKYRHQISEPIPLFNQLDQQVACLESATHTPISNDLSCLLYGVHDGGLNNSQLFTIDPSTLVVTPISPSYPGKDIEGLDIHPQTNILYASSGDDTDQAGYLYKGIFLTSIGNIMDSNGYDYKEVDGLSFNPVTGELWGWAQNDGLIKIAPTNAEATMMVAYTGEVEDLTWNISGTKLYAVENLHSAHDVDSHGPVDFEEGIRLLGYDGNTVEQVCPQLINQLEEIEALEMITDESLLIGYHGNNTLKAVVVDLLNCNIIVEKEITSPYTDVEGIAWSVPKCTFNN